MVYIGVNNLFTRFLAGSEMVLLPQDPGLSDRAYALFIELSALYRGFDSVDSMPSIRSPGFTVLKASSSPRPIE